MSVYTVHAPPAPHADPLPAAERIVFVRDGFSFWAFVFAPLWMLWHRMWLVVTAYLVVVAAIAMSMVLVGASSTGVAVVFLLMSLLVGLEASTLRRFALLRRGWNDVGIVSGDDVEEAERRFFASWLRRTPIQDAANASTPPPPDRSAPSVPRAAQPPDIIGLFPNVGGRR